MSQRPTITTGDLLDKIEWCLMLEPHVSKRLLNKVFVDGSHLVFYRPIPQWEILPMEEKIKATHDKSRCLGINERISYFKFDDMSDNMLKYIRCMISDCGFERDQKLEITFWCPSSMFRTTALAIGLTPVTSGLRRQSKMHVILKVRPRWKQTD